MECANPPFVEAYPLDGQDICMVCRGGKPSYDATYSYGSYDGARELIGLFNDLVPRACRNRLAS